MKKVYSVAGYWRHTPSDEKIRDAFGVFATRELAEEFLEKLADILRKYHYETSLFIFDMPIIEVSDDIDAKVMSVEEYWRKNS